MNCKCQELIISMHCTLYHRISLCIMWMMRDPPAHTHQLLTLKSATNGLYTAEVAANSDEINSESLQQAEETALALYKKALPACYWWAIAEPLLACGISHDALQHWLHRRLQLLSTSNCSPPTSYFTTHQVIINSSTQGGMIFPTTLSPSIMPVRLQQLSQQALVMFHCTTVREIW